MLIRPARRDDAPAIADIYAEAVLHGLATFEEVPPSAEELWRRALEVLDHRLPYLAAELDGRVLGYAYASPFRHRTGYRYTAEDTVYVAADARGRGVGCALLTAVIDACVERGLRQLIGVIGDSANAGSIGLHRACGFEHAGLLPAVGWKHGRWVDSVWMRRALGDAGDAPPDAPGLALSGA